MSRGKIAAGAVLLILIMAVVQGVRRSKSPDPNEPAIISERPLPRPGAAPAVPARPLGRYQHGARTPLPRFVPPPGSAPDPSPATAQAAPKLEERGTGELRNKLDKTPPDFPRMQARTKVLLNELHARADKCLAGWSAPDPALREGVMLAIEIDKAGLQQVAIKDMVEIPDGPLRCLSNAAYELDWSGITEAPVMITVPQKYAATR
jgi:hypothetical protein